MAIKREFTCLAHGMFESTEAVCPYGCTSTVERTFTQGGPSIGSKRTRNIDGTLERLAGKYGMTDMSTRNGSVMSSRKRQSNGSEAFWKEMPTGDRLVVGKGVEKVAGSNGGAASIGQQLHTEKLSSDESSFIDIAKGMTVTPNVVASFGSQSELASAVKSA